MTRKFNALRVEEVSRTRLMAEEAKGNLVELYRLRTKNELEAVSKVDKFGEAAGVWWSLLRRLQSSISCACWPTNRRSWRTYPGSSCLIRNAFDLNLVLFCNTKAST